eukprot:jgi/Phyca11/14780/fgenesh1_pg.PHYCAscaffold_9_\
MPPILRRRRQLRQLNQQLQVAQTSKNPIRRSQLRPDRPQILGDLFPLHIYDIPSSEDGDDEFELVPRGMAHRPSTVTDTPIEASLFGSSDEDGSGDEIAIVDDDDGDSDGGNADSTMSSDLEDNLNMIEDGEDPNDFGGLASGEEIDEDDIVDEDYVRDSGAEVGGEHEDEIENEPVVDDINSVESIAERHFTEMFLASLGGSDKVLTGKVVGDDLNKLRTA